MSELLESIKGFFLLGSRHLSNKVRMISLGMRERAIDGEIRDRMRNIGRAGWELGLAEPTEFPAAGKVREFESQLKEKESAVADLEARIEEAQEQRKVHQMHYQRKLSEQIRLKQPVDEELTDLLVEVKRLKKERKATQIEIKMLVQKIDLQRQRMEQMGKGDQESNAYLQKDIESEVSLNSRFLALKRENLQLLDTNIEKCFQQIDRVQLVIVQYDEQIAEIRADQREMLAKDKEQIAKLHELRTAVREQMRKIRIEMSPALERLGGEITTRRIASKNLVEHYRRIDELETRKEKSVRRLAALKRDSDGISFGIKFGFYSLLAGSFILVGWLVYLASKGY